MENITNFKISCKSAALGVSLCMAFALGLCFMTPASAQSPADSGKPISLTLTNAPVVTALKMVFQGAGVNYSVDPAVGGNLTIDLHDVSFEAALKTVLHSVTPSLIAVKDPDGIYYVKVNQNAGNAGSPDGSNPANLASQNGGLLPGSVAPGQSGYNLTPSTSASAQSGGEMMGQNATIQVNYADISLLKATGLFGAMTIIPATSQSLGKGSGGGARMSSSGGSSGGMGGGMSGGGGGMSGGMGGGMSGGGGGMSGRSSGF